MCKLYGNAPAAFLLVVIHSFAIIGAAADSAKSAKIQASSAWQVSQQFITNAHAACDNTSGSGIAECFIDQMAKAGASADAVSFAREFTRQNHGDVGIMTGFQPVGPVDIAWITYPLRANTNHGLLQRAATVGERRRPEIVGQKSNGTEPSVPRPQVSISASRPVAGRSRWDSLAQLAKGS